MHLPFGAFLPEAAALFLSYIHLTLFLKILTLDAETVHLQTAYR